MSNPVLTADCLYVNGDSWTRGSELIDPTSSIENHFDPVHEAYRMKHFWPRLVADQLGLELIDGSMAGGSNDRLLRTTIEDVSRLIMEGRKPFVIVSWTQLHRFELPEKGGHWRSFVNTKHGDTPRAVKEIWGDWSSDRSDVIRWTQQLLTLDYFLKMNKVDYLSTTVFKEIYWLFERFTAGEKDYFKPYLHQINQHVKLSRHSLNLSMETALSWHSDVTYGPGGHPLAKGHELLAEQILSQINSKYQFQRLQDQ